METQPIWKVNPLGLFKTVQRTAKSRQYQIWELCSHLCGGSAAQNRGNAVYIIIHCNLGVALETTHPWGLHSETRFKRTSYLTTFLAATKQLQEHLFPSVRLSVCPSVRLSHLFDNVPVIISSWNFQELLQLTDTMSMQKVNVRGQGQGHRDHDPI